LQKWNALRHSKRSLLNFKAKADPIMLDYVGV